MIFPIAIFGGVFYFAYRYFTQQKTPVDLGPNELEPSGAPAVVVPDVVEPEPAPVVDYSQITKPPEIIVSIPTPTPPVKPLDRVHSNPKSASYDDLIDATEDKYGIPPSMLYRLLQTESSFLPDIISGKRKSGVGAMGIAQFMPATAVEELGSEAAALDPSIAINGAGRYLAKLKNSLGSWEKAVAAYNWGIGNVRKKGLDKLPAETLAYVNSVYRG